MAFIQGGAGFNLLGLSVYKYLCGIDICSIKFNPCEVAELITVTIIQQVYVYTDTYTYYQEPMEKFLLHGLLVLHMQCMHCYFNHLFFLKDSGM